MRASPATQLLVFAVQEALGHDARGFIWMSQGFGLPTAWIAAIPEMPETWLVWGSFGLCDRTLDLPRFHHVCLPRVDWSPGNPVRGNTTYTPGRNLLYRHGLQLEAELQTSFMYFILADDSGEFGFKNCSPQFCGNSDVLPMPSESALSFFHRLLLEDVPAAATPLYGVDDKDCVSALEMRVCTSTLDHKVIALHWSVHAILLPYEESFEQTSLFASQCIMNELLDACFQGYAVHYRMFQRPSSSQSTFPSLRPHYIRNLEPCLPQQFSNASFEDSSVVKWLRPQLRACATERLGHSFLLQSECEPDLSANDRERCNLRRGPRDYRELLSCLPWAKREDCIADSAGVSSAGKFRPPRPSGVHHVKRLRRSFGAGSPLLPSTGACEACPALTLTPDCAMDLLCAVGMQNFTRLLHSRAGRSFAAVDSLEEAWTAAEPRLQRMLTSPRHEVDHECDACVAILLGAYVDPDFLARGLDAAGNSSRQSFWNWWWCVVAFLHRSQIRLFASGSVAPFEMLLSLTEKLLPTESRPAVDVLRSADALAQLASADRPFAVVDPTSQCLMGLAVRHLLDALQDARWAAGHVFAAQQYLAHCDLLELAHPMTSYVWHLFAVVGRTCMNSSFIHPPAAPNCGSRVRLVRRFRAKSADRLAPRIQRLRVQPMAEILHSLM